jgi:hypothetical protein
VSYLNALKVLKVLKVPHNPAPPVYPGYAWTHVLNVVLMVGVELESGAIVM